MKIKPENIKIDQYNYTLPDSRIAKYPMEQRDLSKLLIYERGKIKHTTFLNLDHYIQPGETMVFNNTRVIQARLIFYKETGARIEIFCLEPVNPSDYVLAFQQTQKVSWKCIVGNAKKWKQDTLIQNLSVSDKPVELIARKKISQGNAREIEFSWDNPEVTFSEIIDSAGKTPIPPYLNRDSEKIDRERYQTVYSKQKGSVAAPTAGLHFTQRVLNQLHSKNVHLDEITLHVGAGTFTPVKAETIDHHEMHTEHFLVNRSTLLNLLNAQHITVVGTTSVRTLETIYWLGVKLAMTGKPELKMNQWEVYDLPHNFTKQEALEALLNFMDKQHLETIHASTQIMIAPGYSFKMTDGLITNFHQPQSTLLLLIAAFIGDDWKRVYHYALQNDFRFLSYGDSSILMP
ncbi:MAG: S-adenosylmethionine:tRNA ribosyltransferase-isomerase [Bacteroidales bacterium]|jgi:S-adenosylmethionine:tRNA ribosyltransferase-isomerase|nr:S-adenosylmethionine:tRNA ribosyltransferase-isomerase [Bacteroidales bacterium]